MNSSSSQSRYVKVYKEGNYIGRKINIFAFNNYESLAAALSDMFDTAIRYGEGNSSVFGNHHTLKFLDRDGHWMVAGDISWNNFLSRAQRLRLSSSRNP
ncbi:auxin-responsive protein IAA31-like isoform X2 [Arabidopsis lyrata subsp. lyrata]|uniref:auxin-responsive protein IAA31-like isoform X2 n=1 Tax=Arabidopsis lyrata subsp. lyrata TaxID=81972 RepID=UPI000A29C638|nr:auxin-responsive protein IAA31-like isoform X2 [Arabidopsis lyrata subsp. lyrata]|eukprot:XP_020878614.1 auxin-responsive protein IAA31-like isoform X2 [Arabidopsis lyrata subsp. lyrata]